MHSPCGSTPSAANALGCHFDIMTFAWMPPRCYDGELSRSFDELARWEWYRDGDWTQRVAKSAALTGEHDELYVSWAYHVQHCVYMWKKMHRALLPAGGGKPAIDGYIAPYAHTQHCGMMLLSRGEGYEMDAFSTKIKVKYPDWD